MTLFVFEPDSEAKTLITHELRKLQHLAVDESRTEAERIIDGKFPGQLLRLAGAFQSIESAMNDAREILGDSPINGLDEAKHFALQVFDRKAAEVAAQPSPQVHSFATGSQMECRVPDTAITHISVDAARSAIAALNFFRAGARQSILGKEVPVSIIRQCAAASDFPAIDGSEDLLSSRSSLLLIELCNAVFIAAPLNKISSARLRAVKKGENQGPSEIPTILPMLQK